MFGFDTDTLHRVRGCFEQFPQIHKVLLYGSRAMGTQHPGSDVDITLIGKNLSRKNTLLPLSEALDELLLPFTFDTSIFTQLEKPELIRHILERGVCFYEAEVRLKDCWGIKQLGEVSKYEKIKYTRSNLPYVGLEDIESNTGRHLGSLSPLAVKSSTFHFTQRHVLYGRLRPYLNKVIVPDFEGHCSTEIFPIAPNNQLSREYLFYWLISDETVAKIDATWTGARMPRANMNQVSNFPIPVPPLPEQEAIVAILNQAFAAIDQAKAKLERNIANAKELFQSKLNAIFSQKGEGWVETTLGVVIDVKHGFAFKSEFFTSSGEHVLLTPGNYYEEGGYRDRGAKQKYYSGEIPEGYVMEKGDLLVAMTEQAAGLLGSSLLVPESGKFLHNQRLGLITKNTSKPLDNRFLFHAFNTKRFRQYVHATGTGVKVRHTSPTKIKEAKLSLTFDPKKQKAVIETLDALKSKTDVMTETYRTKLSCLEDLKKSILEKAFSGHLTMSDSLLVG